MLSILFAATTALITPLFARNMAGGMMHTNHFMGHCMGADLAIVGVRKSRPMTDTFAVDTFHVAVTVQNVGSRSQPGNALDSVVMSEHGEKTDVKGLQPLAAGATQTVVFRVRRSTDAGMGTTTLHFVLQNVDGMRRGAQDCNPSNDTANITI